MAFSSVGMFLPPEHGATTRPETDHVTVGPLAQLGFPQHPKQMTFPEAGRLWPRTTLIAVSRVHREALMSADWDG